MHEDGEAIQAAVQQAAQFSHVHSGGGGSGGPGRGCVLLQHGVFVSATINLASNIVFYLAPTAILQASLNLCVGSGSISPED